MASEKFNFESSPVLTVLIICNDPIAISSYGEILASPLMAITSVPNASEGIESVRRQCPDAVILDLQMPDQSELVVSRAIQQVAPLLPVIIVTACSQAEMMIKAMSNGVYEYLLKPVAPDRLREVVCKAIELSRFSRVPEKIEGDLADDLTAADRIVGQSSAMQQVYKRIGRIASSDSTVLILGESGTGKELVARALHRYSKRNGKPFLAINCAALSEALLESELFGHERGAFTGAEQRRVGKFEQIDGGTIFLDEIGDMSPATQAKALRLLQDQLFERVGGNETVKTDVRIIAATNRDLKRDAKEGRFREDLLYRLNGFTIQLPPLRDRPEDIPALAEHFVLYFNRELGKNVGIIHSSTIENLKLHPWPGNIREFQNAIRFAMVNATGEALIPEFLPEAYLRNTVPEKSSFNAASGGEADSDASFYRSDFRYSKVTEAVRELLANDTHGIYQQIIQDVEKHILHVVMSHFRGNQFQAAKRLGISRMTLRSKLRAFGLPRN